MKLIDYVKDRITFILLFILYSLFLTVLLLIGGLKTDFVVIINCFNFIFISIVMISRFIRQKKYFENVNRTMDRLDKKEKKHLILKRLMIYFFTPLTLPIIISIFAVIFIGQMFAMAISMTQILISLFVSIGLFLLIYCIYLIVTYFQFLRNINESV